MYKRTPPHTDTPQLTPYGYIYLFFLIQIEVERLVKFIALLGTTTAIIFFAIGIGRACSDDGGCTQDGIINAFVNGFILVLVANVPEGMSPYLGRLLLEGGFRGLCLSFLSSQRELQYACQMTIQLSLPNVVSVLCLFVSLKLPEICGMCAHINGYPELSISSLCCTSVYLTPAAPLPPSHTRFACHGHVVPDHHSPAPARQERAHQEARHHRKPRRCHGLFLVFCGLCSLSRTP